MKSINAILCVVSALLITGYCEETYNRKAKLGKHCLTNLHCAHAFAECRDSVCRCMEGTERVGHACEPIARYCPFGEPLKAGGQVIKCNSQQSSEGQIPLANQIIANLNGSCPSEYFCLQDAELTYGKHNGFCCPKPQHCPSGVKPPVNHTCNYGEVDSEKGIEYCPYDTHYCYSVSIGSYSSSICCAKLCGTSEVFEEGLCHPPVEVGNPCKFDDQCKPNSASCVKGICSCTPDEVAVSGRCTTPYCPSPIDSLTAKKKPNGEFFFCNSTNECPKESYCTSDKYCCPEPAPYCSSTQSYVSRNDQCDTSGPAQQCGPGKSCQSWFTAITNATSGISVSIGLCCRNRH